MIRHQSVLSAIALLACLAVATAAEPDFTIEIGRRVGAVHKGSTLASLIKAYGAKHVKAAELPGPEGTTIPGVILFGGTDREMLVMWKEERVGKEVSGVQLTGKAWVIQGKLKLGASLADVEALNGSAFKVGGFDWDLGGFADFGGGRLNGKVTVRFYPEGEADESLSGDRQIPSTDKKLKAAKPVVTELAVEFE